MWLHKGTRNAESNRWKKKKTHTRTRTRTHLFSFPRIQYTLPSTWTAQLTYKTPQKERNIIKARNFTKQLNKNSSNPTKQHAVKTRNVLNQIHNQLYPIQLTVIKSITNYIKNKDQNFNNWKEQLNPPKSTWKPPRKK